MKLFHSLIYPLLAGSLCCLSCSDDEQETGIKQPSATGEVTFGVDLTAFSTRVTQDGSSWNEGDKIGAYVLDAKTLEPAVETVNVPYICSEEGSSVSFTSTAPLKVQNDGVPVKFVAYYPYTADMRNFDYPVQLAAQGKGSTACDLLYAATNEDYTYSEETAPHIALNFTHRLSKVILKFVNMEKEPLEVSNVRIEGMQTAASFNVQTDVLTLDESSVATITPYHNATTGFYEAIVLPSALKDTYKVSFVLDNREKEWIFTNLDIALPQFHKGYSYTFALYIDDSGFVEMGRLENVDGGNSSAPWEDGSSEDGTADGDKTPVAGYSLTPADGTQQVLADTELKLSFEGAAPELGTSGFIRIYRMSDHKLVDEISLSDRRESIKDGVTTLNTWMDIIGVTPAGSSVSRRIVNYYPVRVEGNDFIIKPHQQRLQYDTGYYVTIDRSAVKQTDFRGIYGRAWTFKTKPEPMPSGPDYELKISHTDPDADFYTLQGAIDFCATHIDLNAPKTFRMDDGIYQEIIYLRDQSNITVKGNAADNTAVNIQYDNSNDINGGIGGGTNIDQFAPVGTVVPSSGGRSVVILDGNSDKIRFENVTIENAYGWTLGKNGQAEALYINNKSAAFINCRVLSFQDTLLPGGGYNWFKDCFIAGATDFIWGSGKVVLFEDCQLHAPTGTRAVMQARVREGYLGYVFLNSCFTVGAGVTSSTLIYQYEPDNLTFLNCTFADIYGANFVGENKPLTPAVPTVGTGCKLYNCKTESGANLYESIPAAVRNTVLQLSDEQYNQYFGTRKTIMSWDGYTDADWFK